MLSCAALDNLQARKVDFGQIQSGGRDTVTVETSEGYRSIIFEGEDLLDRGIAGPLSDTWKIESAILQCKLKDGQPIRLGRGTITSIRVI